MRTLKREATKFNVITFKNYDGTTTIKVVTREQFQRIMRETK